MSRPLDPTCPVCGRPQVPAHAPFCSRTCRDRDLIAWLEGRYALPCPPDEEGEGEDRR
ncbi:DNA gyrase inhibitor YacG [Thermaurantiacus sp.]